MFIAIDKLDGRGLSNTARHACQAKMSKLKEAYKLPSGSNKTECFLYKGERANA